MSEQKSKDPRVEWGFYAMTPRIVRTKYKQLSHTEKWLYTCLKDLCGKRGTCFRTLRSLKEETDISIASLSTMIPNLHKAGLIHAEKKRSPRSGKEIWHISIVDIWQMNKDYCSEIEQSQKEVVQDLNEDTEFVQSVNNVVQIPNKEQGDCSISERGCSNFSDIRIYPKNKDTNRDTEEEGTYPVPKSPPSDADASTHALSSQDEYRPDFNAQSASIVREVDAQQRAQAQSPSGQAEFSTPAVEKPAEHVEKPPRGRGRSRKAAEPVVEFTEQGRKVFDAWCANFRSTPRAAEKTIDCANALYPRLVPWCRDLKMPCKDLLKEIKDFLFATDTNGFYKRGVTLCDVERDFEKWQSAKEHELEQAKKPKQQPRKDNPLDEMRQQQQRYAAQSERIGV